MLDIHACHRGFKRQLFRRNESLLLIICVTIFLFLFFLHQRGDCNLAEKSFGFERNKNYLSHGVRDTFLFIVVLTSPRGKERRDAIRETWFSHLKVVNSSVTARFVVGAKELPQNDREDLEKENNNYGDILFLPELKDSYYELTNKVLQSFLWADYNINSSYLMKVDDDTFVRLDIILSELEKNFSRTKLYWGFFRGDAHVKFHGPWAENDWHLCDRYLPYAQGGGYILSGDLVNFIARNADLLQKFNSEDVSVGAWLAPLQVNRLHDFRFDTEYRSRGCNNLHIVSHKQSISEMYQKHRQLQENRKLCIEETRLRNSFIYNWAVPPTECCMRVGGIP
ncbi:beta-1,3-galactosyltransferase 6-like [Montipora capricornis]|uniref:beta-1,3-galactosyltransferase 6-like n=1 Tax=Montipora capricornis TaxID=246305 RepID=UPI0035F1060E